MSKKNIKISYDKESRVLSIALGKDKSVDSDIQGNVVLDYDKKGRVVRIDLYNFNFDAFKENRGALKKFVQRTGAIYAG